MVASPYAKRGIVDNSYYTQLNVVKTIEQILGIAPMNQEDRAAWPMFNAFTNKPDFAPYDVVPNQIPLTQGLTTASIVGQGRAGVHARPRPPSSAIPRCRAGDLRGTGWSGAATAGSTAPSAIQDFANPAQLNRLDWYSAHDWKVPYPGDKKILTPNQVPGHNLPADYLGD